MDNERCTLVTEGPCCDVALNPMNQQAVTDYQAALAAHSSAGCVVACPEIPCIENPVGLCTGNENPGSCPETTQ